MAMSDDPRKYSDLLKLLQTTPKRDISAGFTERVMEGLPEEVPFLHRIAGFWIRYFCKSAEPREGRPFRPDYRECPLCLALAGSFYLVFGIVLLAGLNLSGTVSMLDRWTILIPWASIAAALWLFGLTALMIRGGERVLKGTRAGTMIFTVAVPGAIILIAGTTNPPIMYALFTMSAATACMGGLLYYQVAVFSKAKDDAPVKGPNFPKVAL
ncbi:MAG: hypothetical protein M0Q23_09205 [Syntrophales bacterium]|jgi:hypothetical protein|nr:hypothetical protein [Syntrophales bacterium]MCK9528797.1 hypothetical protein [Syntrophales bacterium]MDX9922744.1 hypothetical protein [Syntrophales bacterium]